MFPQPEGEERGEFRFPHTLFAFITTIGVFLFFGFNSALLNAAEKDAYPWVKLLIQGVGRLCFLLLPAILIMYYSPLGRRTLLRLDNPALQAKHWIAALLGIIVLQLFSNGWLSLQSYLLPASVMEGIREFSRNVTGEGIEELIGNSVPLALALVVVSFIPALSEEALFRGLFQRSVEENSGVAVAITHSAVFFAFVHFNPEYILPLIVFGVLLATLAASSRSLLPSMLCHAVNNALSIIVSRNEQLRTADTQMLSMELFPALMYFVFSLVLFIFIIAWLMKRTPHRAAIS